MKTPTGFTPGPWAWCNDNTCLYGNENVKESTQDCILHCDGKINAPNNVNASLIATAPELLEACKKMAAYIRENIEDFNDDIVIDAELAISKAQGGKG